MEPKIDQNATKTPSKTHLFFAPFVASFFCQKCPPKWSPKCHWSPLFQGHFSHVVPDLALGPTFVHFWTILVPPGLHFGLIWVPFWPHFGPLVCPLRFNFGTIWCQKSWSISAYFGIISVPLFAPNASILGPYGARNLGVSISATPLCFVFCSLFDPC